MIFALVIGGALQAAPISAQDPGQRVVVPRSGLSVVLPAFLVRDSADPAKYYARSGNFNDSYSQLIFASGEVRPRTDPPDPVFDADVEKALKEELKKDARRMEIAQGFLNALAKNGLTGGAVEKTDYITFASRPAISIVITGTANGQRLKAEQLDFFADNMMYSVGWLSTDKNFDDLTKALKPLLDSIEIGNGLFKLTTGRYKVSAIGHDSNWALTVNGTEITGVSDWNCCPGIRHDPMSGRLVSDGSVIIVRDCNGQGMTAPCKQEFYGRPTTTGLEGTLATSGTEVGAWTLKPADR